MRIAFAALGLCCAASASAQWVPHSTFINPAMDGIRLTAGQSVDGRFWGSADGVLCDCVLDSEQKSYSLEIPVTGNISVSYRNDQMKPRRTVDPRFEQELERYTVNMATTISGPVMGQVVGAHFGYVTTDSMTGGEDTTGLDLGLSYAVNLMSEANTFKLHLSYMGLEEDAVIYAARAGLWRTLLPDLAAGVEYQFLRFTQDVLNGGTTEDDFGHLTLNLELSLR